MLLTESPEVTLSTLLCLGYVNMIFGDSMGALKLIVPANNAFMQRSPSVGCYLQDVQERSVHEVRAHQLCLLTPSVTLCGLINFIDRVVGDKI